MHDAERHSGIHQPAEDQVCVAERQPRAVDDPQPRPEQNDDLQSIQAAHVQGTATLTWMHGPGVALERGCDAMAGCTCRLQISGMLSRLLAVQANIRQLDNLREMRKIQFVMSFEFQQVRPLMSAPCSCTLGTVSLRVFGVQSCGDASGCCLPAGEGRRGCRGAVHHGASQEDCGCAPRNQRADHRVVGEVFGQDGDARSGGAFSAPTAEYCCGT